MSDTHPESRRSFLRQGTLLAGGLAMVGSPFVESVEAQAAAAATPQSKRSRLRELIAQPGTQLAVEAHSPLASRLAELHGFQAIYMGGHMLSGVHLGIEDWGLITPTEFVELASRIAGAVSIPAIVDADQGGETSLNVYRTVKSYERAGIAGLHIEDTLNPKHTSTERYGASEGLQSIELMAERIKAAVAARTDPNFVIICRSDSMGTAPYQGNVEESIRRGIAFAKAGGDMFMPMGLTNEQRDRIAAAVPIPLAAVNVSMKNAGNRLKLNLYGPGKVFWALAKLYETQLLELKEQGDMLENDARSMSMDTLAKAQFVSDYRKLADTWTKVKGAP